MSHTTVMCMYSTVMRDNILCSLYHEVFSLLDDWPCSGCNEPCCPVHTREKAVWTKNLGFSGRVSHCQKTSSVSAHCSLLLVIFFLFYSSLPYRLFHCLLFFPFLYLLLFFIYLKLVLVATQAQEAYALVKTNVTCFCFCFCLC